MGDKEWVCVFPKSEGICTVQGDPVVAADQPDPQLCKGVGANCVKGLCEQYAVLLISVLPCI